jgi:hypothetical protein
MLDFWQQLFQRNTISILSPVFLLQRTRFMRQNSQAYSAGSILAKLQSQFASMTHDSSARADAVDEDVSVSSFGSAFDFHGSFMAREDALLAHDQFADPHVQPSKSKSKKLRKQQAVIAGKETQRLEAAASTSGSS